MRWRLSSPLVLCTSRVCPLAQWRILGVIALTILKCSDSHIYKIWMKRSRKGMWMKQKCRRRRENRGREQRKRQYRMCDRNTYSNSVVRVASKAGAQQRTEKYRGRSAPIRDEWCAVSYEAARANVAETTAKEKKKTHVTVSQCAKVWARVSEWLTLEAFRKQEAPRRRASHWLARRTGEVEAAAEASARGARSRSFRADGGSPRATAAEEREGFERTRSAENERRRMSSHHLHKTWRSWSSCRRHALLLLGKAREREAGEWCERKISAVQIPSAYWSNILDRAQKAHVRREDHQFHHYWSIRSWLVEWTGTPMHHWSSYETCDFEPRAMRGFFPNRPIQVSSDEWNSKNKQKPDKRVGWGRGQRGTGLSGAKTAAVIVSRLGNERENKRKEQRL